MLLRPARKLLFAAFLAVDLFASALEWARKNFKRNHVDIEVEINDLTRDMDGTFDVIVANLPPAPQCENLRNVVKNLNDDGILIISWYNVIPLKDFNKHFEIVEHIEGREYDVYVLKKK